MARKSSSVRAVVVAALVGVGVGCTKVNHLLPIPEPALWVPTAEPPADSEKRECANLTDWTVVLEAQERGGLRAKIAREGRALRDVLPPFAVERDHPGLGGVLSLRVENGWLIAVNAGEFGGALWWYGPDGDTRYRIADLSVVGLHALPAIGANDRYIAIEVLSHRGEEIGRVQTVVHGSGGRWELRPIASLPSAPHVSTTTSDGGVVIALTGGVAKVKADGTVEVARVANLGQLYPSSISEASDGSILVGMRRYLLRVPRARGGKAEWFTLAACKDFSVVRSQDAPARCECGQSK